MTVGRGDVVLEDEPGVGRRRTKKIAAATSLLLPRPGSLLRLPLPLLLIALLRSRVFAYRAGSDTNDTDGDEDDDPVMEVDGTEDEEVDEVVQAKAAAKALGTKSSLGSGTVGDVFDGLAELNMDAYDDEEDGLELFSTRLGDLYYESNEEDPYIIKNDDEDDGEDDDEEIKDMTIKSTDIVIVCAHNKDEFNSLQVSIVEELEDGDPNMFVRHEVPLSDFLLCTAWMDFNRQDLGPSSRRIRPGPPMDQGFVQAITMVSRGAVGVKEDDGSVETVKRG
ncbi:uncharacterized WD repeat-containing protein C17D11.16-like [Triticum dicoccoides]|uniref:uncharacterized WD repeat-containing protein C17D11.16-like n=1 Tax=Triticum dicoccoides TaxID=85692 RepID=UPI00188DE3BC|nr:uncharacterized WD repeat-containing protein C17D11.16-like [Triticum dicoccoides]